MKHSNRRKGIRSAPSTWGRVGTLAICFAFAVAPVCVVADYWGGDPVVPEAYEYPDSECHAQDTAVGTTVTTNETEVTPEIQSLAYALGNDPLRIYEYVRNHIDYTPNYLCRNGASGCLRAGQGNDWDQSALLASLLRVAGYTNRFVSARVAYETSDMGEWFGVNANAASNVLTEAAVVNGAISNNPTRHAFVRCWVQIRANGAWYDMDPAYKTYQNIAGVNVAAAMAYDRASFLTNAMAGATVSQDWIQTVNETNVTRDLTAYTTNLVRYIQTNCPAASVADIVGGRRIVPVSITNLSTGLPKQWYLWESTRNSWDHLPADKHVAFRIQHRGLDRTFRGYEIADKRVSVFYDTTNNYRPYLSLDGARLATGDITTNGSTNQLTLTIGEGTQSTTGTVNLICSVGCVIVHDLGGASAERTRIAHVSLAKGMMAGLPTNSEAVLGGGMQLAALTGLQQWERSRRLHARTAHVVATLRFHAGILSQQNGFYLDQPLLNAGAGSISNSVADQQSFLRAYSFFASALEHGSLEQSQQGAKQCASTVKLLQVGNSNGKKTFVATSNNWPTVSNALVNYTAAQKTSIGSELSSGFICVLPEDALIQLQQWKGIGYASYRGSPQAMGMWIDGGYSGGAPCTPGMLNSAAVLDNSRQTVAPWPDSSKPIITGADPVDLRTGNLVMDRTDLSVGATPSPSGLAFSRTYDGGQSLSMGALGYGWTHNLDAVAAVASHGDTALGARQPADAAAAIVEAYVTTDLLRGSPDARQWLCAAIVARWGVDQLLTNAVVIRTGGRSLEYVGLPDGSFVAPPGTTATLSRNNATLVLEQRFGVRWLFNSNGTLSAWRDADSNAIQYTYNSATNIATISNNFGRVISMFYSPAGLLTNVADTVGRTVSYQYASNHLVTVVDAEGASWTYAYDTNHSLVSSWDPVARLSVSNAYDSLARVQRQINGAGNTWSIYTSRNLGVEEDPQGGRTIHYFDDDGRNLGTQDALSNRTYRFYDGQGHLTTNIDARGYTTVFQYDGNHNVTNRIDALTNRTAYAYDSQFHLTAVTDPLGHVTHYGYDAKHHVTNVVDALTNVSTMTYTSKGLLQQLSEGNGLRVTTYAYDSAGNAIAVSRTDGGTISNQYDSAGNLTVRIDQNARTNRFTWDKRRLMTSDTDGAGFTVSNVYDAAGLLIKTLDRNGNTNQTTYTATYNPATVILPNGGTNAYSYDSRDWLVSVADPLGRTTSNVYDRAGRKIAVLDPLQNRTSFTLDANGNIVAQTNALLHVTHYAFDPLNRLTNTWDVLPGGTRSVASVFDTAGRLVTATDAAGLTTQFQYDALNRKTAVIKPDGTSEHFEYDGLGNLTAFVNGEGRRTVMTYDGMGRQRSVTDPLTNRVSYAYDPVGNLTARTNASGVVVQHQYNAVNSLQRTIYPGGVTNTYAYDKNRLLTNAVDTLGSSRFAYDRMNWQTQAVSVVGSVTSTVAYVYDLKGNRTRVVYPGGMTVTNAFDAANRLATVADWIGRTLTYTYNALHSPTGVVYPNGVTGTFTWDDAARLTGVGYRTNGVAFVDRQYTLDAVGNRMQEDVNAGLMPALTPDVRRMTQDAADRLTLVQQKTYPDSPAWTNSTPNWDANGNMLSDGNGLTLAYDFDNRVTNLQSAVIGNRVFYYDGTGVRAKRLVGGTNYVDVLDRAGAMGNLLMIRGTNGTALRYFVWGRGLAWIVETSGVVRYAHADGQGNILALTSTNGAVTDQWFYSPYGSVLNRTGNTDTPFQWLGGHGVRYEGGGIYLTRYRVYHAGLMRFTTPDPIGLAGGNNLFAYAGGNPLAFIDALGLNRAESGLYYQNPTPDFLRGSPPSSASWYGTALQTAGEVGLSFIPGGGEALDVMTITDPNAATWQRALSVGSLALSVVTLGTSPNAGAGIRAADRIVDATPSSSRIPSTLYHYTSAENVGSIMENGLGAGGRRTWTTPAGNLSPVQAQIELALPPNRGYPSALLEIDTARLQQLGITPAAGPQRVMSTPTAGGGGIEILFNQPIPPSAIRQVSFP